MLPKLLLLTLLWPAGAFAQTAQVDPMTLRARDAHQNLTILADPYLSAERYDKARFGKKSPFEAGIVAINVYFRNDNDSAIRLNLNSIQLIVSTTDDTHQRLNVLTPQDVADRTILDANANPNARPRFPGSANSGKSKAWIEMDDSIQAIAVSSDVLPPHATTHGFVFFDMNHHWDAVRRSHLYIPDLIFMTDKKALFFFEVDLSVVPVS